MSLTLVSKPGGPEPFDFADYRAWLVAWFEHRAGRPSMRGFARRVKCSPTLVSQICRGHRSLSQQRAEEWVPFLGLEDDAARYFLALVQREEAPSSRQRAEARRLLEAFTQFQGRQSEEALLTRMFASWLHPLLHEMARLEEFRADPQWLADRIGPDVDPVEVQRAVDWMREAGLIGPDQDGRMQALNEAVSSEQWVEGSALAKALHEAQFDALEAVRDYLPTLPSRRRNYTTLTAALSRGQQEALLGAILEFQRRAVLIATTEDGQPKEAVYQLSTQWFPLTDPVE